MEELKLLSETVVTLQENWLSYKYFDTIVKALGFAMCVGAIAAASICAIKEGR